jgi:type II secretion system protein N
MLAGTVDGDFSKKGRRVELMLEGRDVNLQRIPFLREVKGVEMTGTLKGNAMIALREGDLSGQSGLAEFQIRGAILNILPLPGIAPLRVGHIQGSIELKRGKITIKRLSSSGRDFDGQILGNIFLNSHLPLSRLNLKITIKPSGEFDSRYGMLLSLFGPQGKTKGIYAFSLEGTLFRPRLLTK